ncbi:pyroglutamyl peptidase domain-containing protein [Hirsutella rhossiliensis]|uniref:Pyroglutamyl peptidase domain-containing protein n=1 Tax=Hirsutella rhossiliensis TaxID=111463 RepID=A0A9P8MZP3_9HYPO|nr:pyroglutamyl peptidase domain-containing protein [Hirsutella rhossiliensis]KAH0963221.1 pyroglutamyl peptidase domain-containing protein [Hirsutella rhossiliensis]
MGSQSNDRRELTVLVTGFGPFRDQYPVNPAWEIAKGLPARLPALLTKDRRTGAGAVDIPPVRILVHPEPVRVSYEAVRELVPAFWDTYQGRRVDVAIHIGMAGPRPFYHIERKAHRTGYASPDVDGKKLDDQDEAKRGDDWIWHGLPDEIETDLDLDNVLQRWQGHSSKDMDLRISEDAGRYLCDFIYYSTLSTLLKQQRPRKAVFFHVPCDASERHITQGRELAVNLIRAIAESETARAAAGELAVEDL